MFFECSGTRAIKQNKQHLLNDAFKIWTIKISYENKRCKPTKWGESTFQSSSCINIDLISIGPADFHILMAASFSRRLLLLSHLYHAIILIFHGMFAQFHLFIYNTTWKKFRIFSLNNCKANNATRNQIFKWHDMVWIDLKCSGFHWNWSRCNKVLKSK